jgi:hypothetical protein
MSARQKTIFLWRLVPRYDPIPSWLVLMMEASRMVERDFDDVERVMEAESVMW